MAGQGPWYSAPGDRWQAGSSAASLLLDAHSGEDRFDGVGEGWQVCRARECPARRRGEASDLQAGVHALDEIAGLAGDEVIGVRGPGLFSSQARISRDAGNR